MARRWARAHRRRPYGTLNLTPLREATISSRQVSRALRDVLSFTSRDPAILRAARNRLRSPCKCAVNLKESGSSKRRSSTCVRAVISCSGMAGARCAEEV